ncbi:MAG: hypothetical protein AABN34_17285 [Acidobacteriota bacterium]
MQSRLEEWWIRIDDFRHKAMSSHIAFMKVLASVLTNFFNRFFGPRVLSQQSIGVSLCYSIVWIGIGLLMLRRLSPRIYANYHDVTFEIELIAFGLIYGAIPYFIPKNVWHPKWISWIAIWFWTLILIVLWSLFDPMGLLMILSLAIPGAKVLALVFLVFMLAVVAAMLLFVTCFGIMRITLRSVSQSESPIKITGLTLLNAAPIASFYGLFEFARFLSDLSGDVAIIVLIITVFVGVCLILFNLAFVLSGLLFVGLAIVMLLHRLFWPSIQRPLYKLQALGIAKRPKVFAAIGLILLGIAFGKQDWLKTIFDKLW